MSLMVALTATREYVIDGKVINRLLDTYQVDSRMLQGQVFDIVEKKLIKTFTDEIDKVKPETVRFLDLDAVLGGPYKDFAYAICGGLAGLVDSLVTKKIAADGTMCMGTETLPWNLRSRIDKNFRGHIPDHPG